jgi:catechol 2,3-dioxygenase-like lactoylglutathione lyase family enzyme
MPRIDHVAVETKDPNGIAAFYERVFSARIVKTEGHPMAYLGNTGFAFHERGGSGGHMAVASLRGSGRRSSGGLKRPA